MVVAEVVQHPVSCGQKITAEATLPSKIVNKNLRNQMIHSKATLDKCNFNQDTTGTPIVTESKVTNFHLTSQDDVPPKVEFFQEKSSESSSSKQFSIEELNSNEESSDDEKESYQSMLEHLNKLNMAKSLMETQKKKKAEVMLKKEVEKGYDDEKDTAEYSTRKYEEDQELNIMKIKYDNECNEIYDYFKDVGIYQTNGGGDAKISMKSEDPLLIEDFMFPRTNTVIDLELKNKTEQNNEGDDYPNCKKKLTFDMLMAENNDLNSSVEFNKKKENGYVHEPYAKCFESLTIDTEEIENFKEFSQPSPKENSDVEGNNFSGLDYQSVWNNFENDFQTRNTIDVPPSRNTERFEGTNVVTNRVQTTDTEDSCTEGSITEDNSNLVSLKKFGNSRESDLDSNISSDSNRLYEESQTLSNSGSFLSTEKLKELCDSENERCRTPSEQMPDKETIKRKLNELNQKKLKDMANIGVPTIEEHPEVVDKNDKNRPGQNQGCRPKVFNSSNASTTIATNSEQIQPNFSQTRSRSRSRPINLHKLRQEINERLKQEEVQASLGELAAGGGWDFINTESEIRFSHRHSVYPESNYNTRRNASLHESSRYHHTTQDDYALPQPRWPCEEVNPTGNEQFNIDDNNTNNNSNFAINRRGSNRATRRKVAKKTKAL